MDRRNKPRVSCYFPALIQGQDEAGNVYKITGWLCNMSADGLYLVSRKGIQPGDELSIDITLPGSIPDDDQRLVTICVVQRTEAVETGAYGIGLKISNYRFE